MVNVSDHALPMEHAVQEVGYSSGPKETLLNSNVQWNDD